MNGLFLGMALVFLDWNIEIGVYTLDILPDFLGYFLMMWGLEPLARLESRFEKARPAAMAMSIYSAVVCVAELLAVSVYSRALSFFLGLVALMAGLVLSGWIVSGVCALERDQKRDLEGQRLHAMWLYAAIIQGITYLCGWIPLVGDVGSIAALVMNICFLAAFYRTKERYDTGS